MTIAEGGLHVKSRIGFLHEPAPLDLGMLRWAIEPLKVSPFVCEAAIFGSRARGTARWDSDLDILLTARDPDNPSLRFVPWLLLADLTATRCHYTVEVIFAHLVPPDSMVKIMHDKIVLYEC